VRACVRHRWLLSRFARRLHDGGCSASKPESFLHCLAPHPNYLYYVATGDSAGNLSIWDTRNSQMPFVSHRHHQSNSTHSRPASD